MAVDTKIIFNFLLTVTSLVRAKKALFYPIKIYLPNMLAYWWLFPIDKLTPEILTLFTAFCDASVSYNCLSKVERGQFGASATERLEKIWIKRPKLQALKFAKKCKLILRSTFPRHAYCQIKFWKYKLYSIIEFFRVIPWFYGGPKILDHLIGQLLY